MKSFAGSKAIGVNALSANPKAAMQLAAFLGSVEAQKAHYEMRGIIPAHKNLANNDKVKADQVAKAELDTIANASALQPALPQMDDFWGPMGNFGGKIVAGDIITSLNGHAIRDDLLLDLWASGMEEGDSVEIVLYRSGTELSFTLTWGSFS